MAAKKQKTPSSGAAWLRGLLSWLFGPGRLLLILVVLLAAFGGGAHFAWLKYKERILNSPEYRVAPEQVEITPLPPWIHSNVRAEVLRTPTLDGPLSIVDDTLVDRIVTGFSQHPWVAKVQRVAKQYGSVKVDLVYRKPVCMVQVPGGFFPVDVEAVLLPSEDFTPVETTRYPRLQGVDRGPTGMVGSRWSDAKVIGGAEIAAVVIDVWEPMRFDHIEPSDADPTIGGAGGTNSQTTPDSLMGRPAEPFFTLVTHSGTRVLWGYAPGANAKGWPSTEEKLARLKRYLEKNDTLDGPEGLPKQVLDVRTLPSPTQP